MLFLFLANFAFHFAYVDREGTRSLVQNWKPTSINGNLIGEDESIRNYLKATIKLNDMTSNVCGLVSCNMSVFVIAITGETCEVRSCLWKPDVSRVDTMRSLRHWVGEKKYNCIASLDGTDDSHWDMSEYSQ